MKIRYFCERRIGALFDQLLLMFFYKVACLCKLGSTLCSGHKMQTVDCHGKMDGRYSCCSCHQSDVLSHWLAVIVVN